MTFLICIFLSFLSVAFGHDPFSSSFNTVSAGHWDGMLSISIITNAATKKRFSSLQRLMRSLAGADYSLLPTNASISLHVHMDVDATSEVVDYIQSFDWPFGDKSIHR